MIVDGDHRLLDEAKSEDLLLSMLEHAGSLDPCPALPQGMVERLVADFESHLASRRSQTAVEERKLNGVRVERFRTTLGAALDHRVSEALKRLETLEAKRAAAFSITMARAKLEHAKREREARLNEIGQGSTPNLETELVAVGVLLIGPASD